MPEQRRKLVEGTRSKLAVGSGRVLIPGATASNSLCLAVALLHYVQQFGKKEDCICYEKLLCIQVLSVGKYIFSLISWVDQQRLWKFLFHMILTKSFKPKKAALHIFPMIFFSHSFSRSTPALPNTSQPPAHSSPWKVWAPCSSSAVLHYPGWLTTTTI